MSTYGERLKEARSEAKLTQKALAAKAGLSQVTISDGERGRNSGSVATAAVAAALGIEPLWLSEGKGPKRRIGSASEASAQDEQITIPPVIAPDEPAPILHAVEQRTVARPPLTDDEYDILDGYRVAPDADRKAIRGMCLCALRDYGHREGERQKKA